MDHVLLPDASYGVARTGCLRLASRFLKDAYCIACRFESRREEILDCVRVAASQKIGSSIVECLTCVPFEVAVSVLNGPIGLSAQVSGIKGLYQNSILKRRSFRTPTGDQKPRVQVHS